MSQKRLLPDRLVRQRMGDIAPSTLYRWDRNPQLGFPKPVVINGRKYRDEQELEDFLRSHAAAEGGDPAKSRQKLDRRTAAERPIAAPIGHRR